MSIYYHPFFDGCFEHNNYHVTKTRAFQTSSVFLNMSISTQIASTVNNSQSNRAPLEYGGIGNLYFGYAADQFAALCDAIMCQYGPRSQSNVSSTLLNIMHKELSRSQRPKKVAPYQQAVTNKITLMYNIRHQKYMKY